MEGRGDASRKLNPKSETWGVEGEEEHGIAYHMVRDLKERGGEKFSAIEGEGVFKKEKEGRKERGDTLEGGPPWKKGAKWFTRSNSLGLEDATIFGSPRMKKKEKLEERGLCAVIDPEKARPLSAQVEEIWQKPSLFVLDGWYVPASRGGLEGESGVNSKAFSEFRCL